RRRRRHDWRQQRRGRNPRAAGQREDRATAGIRRRQRQGLDHSASACWGDSVGQGSGSLMVQKKVSVIIAHDTGMSGDWVAEHIPRANGVDVKEVVDSLSADSVALKSSDAEMLVVACSDDSDDALHLVE